MLATEVVRKLAVDPGGLFWTDSSGGTWAVRLRPASNGERSSYTGFAIGWDGNAKELHFGGRAEQLLSTIHLAVLKQERSTVILPDVLLGQIIWGGRRSNWPRDWRGDVHASLWALRKVCGEVLRLSRRGWCPQLGSQSLAVSQVDKLWIMDQIMGSESDIRQDECRPACLMWDSHSRHHHFAVHVGMGFLGVLENFAVDSQGGARRYNFYKDPEGEAGEALRECRKEGQLININAPLALLGQAKWADLSANELALSRSFDREVTRAKGKSHAVVFVGGKVPGKSPASLVHCPFLAGGRHVAFCGNGRRPGFGYKMLTWLTKCGYPVPREGAELGGIVRQFLRDLGIAAAKMDLIASGYMKAGCWLSLDELQAHARSSQGLGTILEASLRIYGPEDWQQRCRDYLSSKGGFSAIPGDESPSDADLLSRIRRAGVKQVELAAVAGVSQPFISQILSRNRSCPAEVQDRLEAWLSQRQVETETDDF